MQSTPAACSPPSSPFTHLAIHLNSHQSDLLRRRALVSALLHGDMFVRGSGCSARPASVSCEHEVLAATESADTSNSSWTPVDVLSGVHVQYTHHPCITVFHGSLPPAPPLTYLHLPPVALGPYCAGTGTSTTEVSTLSACITHMSYMQASVQP